MDRANVLKTKLGEATSGSERAQKRLEQAIASFEKCKAEVAGAQEAYRAKRCDQLYRALCDAEAKLERADLDVGMARELLEQASRELEELGRAIPLAELEEHRELGASTWTAWKDKVKALAAEVAPAIRVIADGARRADALQEEWNALEREERDLMRAAGIQPSGYRIENGYGVQEGEEPLCGKLRPEAAQAILRSRCEELLGGGDDGKVVSSFLSARFGHDAGELDVGPVEFRRRVLPERRAAADEVARRQAEEKLREQAKAAESRQAWERKWFAEEIRQVKAKARRSYDSQLHSGGWALVHWEEYYGLRKLEEKLRELGGEQEPQQEPQQEPAQTEAAASDAGA
jgi:hypothetical protein